MANKLDGVLVRRCRRLGLPVKMIGDSPHARAKCFRCGESIWVSVYSVSPGGVALRGCSDCCMLRKKGGVPDKAAAADMRYHGV